MSRSQGPQEPRRAPLGPPSPRGPWVPPGAPKAPFPGAPKGPLGPQGRRRRPWPWVPMGPPGPPWVLGPWVPGATRKSFILLARFARPAEGKHDRATSRGFHARHGQSKGCGLAVFGEAGLNKYMYIYMYIYIYTYNIITNN